MKKTTFFIVLASLASLFCSCEDNGSTINYYIKNKTSGQLVISLANSNDNILLKGDSLFALNNISSEYQNTACVTAGNLEAIAQNVKYVNFYDSTAKITKFVLPDQTLIYIYGPVGASAKQLQKNIALKNNWTFQFKNEFETQGTLELMDADFK
jgi:hypothetical protein